MALVIKNIGVILRDGDRNGYDVNLNYDKKFTNPKQKLTSYLRFSDGLNDGLNEYYNNDEVVQITYMMIGQKMVKMEQVRVTILS
ncbi:MAG: hypothetical protein Ct9H300mP18_04960 [Candidatus Neomarinimicrobiota bacterium]|nr:MAG: hypothetical protein Ct9H300mP18_04960 [Candidatus Neomarinimicrobiota bacterium]